MFRQSSTRRTTTGRSVSNLFQMTRCLGAVSCPVIAILESLDYSIGSRQHVRWNCQADLLGGFKVYHQIQFHGSLDRQFRWGSPFENLINVNGGAAIVIVGIRASVGHEAASLHIVPITVYRRQSALHGEVCYLFLVKTEHRVRKDHERVGAFLFHRNKCPGQNLQLL